MSYTKKSKHRKFLPTLGELIDRLSIHQLKEVFIPENKDNYAQEMHDIVPVSYTHLTLPTKA